MSHIIKDTLVADSGVGRSLDLCHTSPSVGERAPLSRTPVPLLEIF